MILFTGMFFLYVTLACWGRFGRFLHYVLWGQALMDETALERAAEEEKCVRKRPICSGRQDHIRRL